MERDIVTEVLKHMKLFISSMVAYILIGFTPLTTTSEWHQEQSLNPVSLSMDMNLSDETMYLVDLGEQSSPSIDLGATLIDIDMEFPLLNIDMELSLLDTDMNLSSTVDMEVSFNDVDMEYLPFEGDMGTWRS